MPIEFTADMFEAVEEEWGLVTRLDARSTEEEDFYSSITSTSVICANVSSAPSRVFPSCTSTSMRLRPDKLLHWIRCRRGRTVRAWMCARAGADWQRWPAAEQER